MTQQQLDFNLATLLRVIDTRFFRRTVNGVALRSSTRTQRQLLKAIVKFCGSNPTAWPSVSTLQKSASLSRRAVQFGTADLERLGLCSINARYRPGGKGQTSNEFRPNYQAIWELPEIDAADSADLAKHGQASPRPRTGIHPSAPPQSSSSGTPSTLTPGAQVPVSSAPKSVRGGAQIVRGGAQIVRGGGANFAPLESFIESSSQHSKKTHDEIWLNDAIKVNWRRKLLRRDLRDGRTVLELHGIAVDRGWIDPSEDTRIMFFALCWLASRKDNPGGFLTIAIQTANFEGVSNEDIDVARKGVKKWVHGVSDERGASLDETLPAPDSQAKAERVRDQIQKLRQSPLVQR